MEHARGHWKIGRLNPSKYICRPRGIDCDAQSEVLARTTKQGRVNNRPRGGEFHDEDIRVTIQISLKGSCSSRKIRRGGLTCDIRIAGRIYSNGKDVD